jgi:hypothetical protein
MVSAAHLRGGKQHLAASPETSGFVSLVNA